MNLLRKELKDQLKSTLIWIAAITAFMFLSMTKFTALSGDTVATQQIMQAFPATIQAIFGMTGLDLTTIEGYYGNCLVFLAVMLALHAGLLGARIVAKEESDKTAEFLFARPIGRIYALSYKILAGIIAFVIIAAATYAASYVSIMIGNNGTVPTTTMALFTAALFVIQLLFFCLGVASAAALSIPKQAASLIAGLVFISYITYILWGLGGGYEWMQNISPFAYFAARNLLNSGALMPAWLLVCAAACSALIAVSYLRYAQRDLKV